MRRRKKEINKEGGGSRLEKILGASDAFRVLIPGWCDHQQANILACFGDGAANHPKWSNLADAQYPFSKIKRTIGSIN
jgi:hypothetical protein